MSWQEADAFAGLRVCMYTDRFGFNKEKFERKEIWTRINEEILPRHMKSLERLLEEGKTGWLTDWSLLSLSWLRLLARLFARLAFSIKLLPSLPGWLAGTEQPTIADIFWVCVLMQLMEGWGGIKDYLDAYPSLKDLVDRCVSCPLHRSPAFFNSSSSPFTIEILSVFAQEYPTPPRMNKLCPADWNAPYVHKAV